MLLEPREVHSNISVHKAAEFKALIIDPELFTNTAEELGVAKTPHFRLGHTEDPRLLASVYRFCASVEAEETVLEQQTLFTRILKVTPGKYIRASR